MSDKPNGQDKPQQAAQFGWRFDNDADPKIFYIEIPLQKVAADESINGMCFMLGFFEQCKNEAIARVKIKRQKIKAEMASRIIRPGDAVIPFPNKVQ